MEQRRIDREDREGYGSIYSNAPKYITSWLALMNLLIAAAIVGGVVMYGNVTALNQKVDLIISGHIRIANAQ